MNQKKYVVEKEITINASPAKVWEALTNPEITKEYFYGCKVYSDWKAGHDIAFKRKFLWMNIDMHGKIIEAEAGKLLKYNLKNGKDAKPDNISVVTDRLTNVNGKTVLHITDDVGSAEGAEKRYKKSQKGWNKILNGLKKVVEEKHAVFTHSVFTM